MSFQKKIIKMFYKSATSSNKNRNFFIPLGVFFFFTLMFLFVFVSILFDKILSMPSLFFSPLNIIFGVPVIAIGLFLTIWCVSIFIKRKGTPVPFSPPPKLVVLGPYKYSRNPMLTGCFILLFGLGFLLNSISLVFIFTPLFILIMTIELKIIEEPELEKRLGKEYIEYKKKVPMFIPWLRKGIRK